MLEKLQVPNPKSLCPSNRENNFSKGISSVSWCGRCPIVTGMREYARRDVFLPTLYIRHRLSMHQFRGVVEAQ